MKPTDEQSIEAPRGSAPLDLRWHEDGLAVDAGRARLDALVELLNDDSRSVLGAVRGELERVGKPAVPALRRAARSSRARLRARARSLLHDRARRDAVRRLLRHVCRNQIDLERALYLLARLDDPAFDSRPYRKALDAMGAEVARRVAREPDPFARPMALSQYLGNELGFVGSESDFHHSDNIHLHRAIERKRGMPLTLTAIYVFVARRAGIRAAPIALPGRVLLRLYAGRRALIVDPFQGGRARTRTDCIRYLAQQQLVPRPEWFRDVRDAALFQRHVLNLMNSYQMRGLEREARGLHRVAVTLSRAHTRSTAAAT